MPVLRPAPPRPGAALGPLLAAALALAAAPPAAPDDGEQFFRERIYPLLEQNCFECHGPAATRLRGGLYLNGSAALLRGGDSGPALVPGDAEASLLVQAVRRADPDLSMPPRRVLAPEDVAAIERWVALGAPWPEDLVATARAAQPDAAAEDVAVPDSVPPTDPESLRFFENEVRPLLVERCHECHGPALEKVKSGLRMSGRKALLRGGLRGPALVPGRSDDSLLVRAVRWSDADLSMPPDDKLSPREIETLERWVALGAPWPDAGGDDAEADAPAAESGIDLQAGRTWWSFRPVVRPPLPSPEPGTDAAHPIDAFVNQRLAAAGLQPASAATPEELVRRASFDLLGLPPAFEDVQAFVNDPAPDAWPRLVDQLLARPQYGERWGRHWLDVVRWAQTNGYEQDEEKAEAWRYRDYVIGAFNADKPYDRFVLEQLAGDELPDRDDESLVATGFYRIGVWDSEPDDTEQATFDELDDLVRTIGEGFLGVTIGCARCHDHKFDPIGQEDYFSTLALLRNVRRYTEARYTLDSPVLRPLGLDRQAAETWERDKLRQIEDYKREHRALLVEGRRRAARVLAAASPDGGPPGGLPEIRREDAVEQLDYEERQRFLELTVQIDKPPRAMSFAGSLDWALAVTESPPPVPDTHVLFRGRASSPGAVVPPRFVRVLCASDADALPELPEPAPRARSSGRRLALAQWIASPDNPVTARVLVNRVWQHHFGRGLSDTPNDFGRSGSPPSHPELLDWLASEFVSQGWSIKRLHRLIMTSETYRRSSRADDPAAVEADPGNVLLGRQNLRRIEAEALRDAVLAVSGTLDLTPGGRGFFPALSREAMAGSSRPGKGWEISTPEEASRRTVYAFVKRAVIPPLLEIFDYGNVSLPVGSRPVTTLASQALTLLNSEFLGATAAAFAERVRREAGPDPEAQVVRAFELALARRPAAEELALALEALEQQRTAFARIPPTLDFRSLLPARVDVGFLARAQGRDVLFGPRAGWSYLPGAWGTPYNLTKTVDPAAGPAGLLEGEDFRDGGVQARVAFRDGCELGALLLRAAPDAGRFTGVEALLEPPTGRARLVLHAAGAAPRVLAEAKLAFEADRWRDLRFEVRGPSATLWLDGADEPLLTATDPALDGRGRFGVRAWGDAFSLVDVLLTADGQARPVPPDDPGTPAQRSLQALCLALLNLNEFVYVD